MKPVNRSLVGLSILVTAVLLFPALPLKSSWITTLNFVGIYTLPALGVVLLTGISGMLSFGQAAFVGIGAYTSALVSAHTGWSPWWGLPAGWLVTAVAGRVLGSITLRMSGPYLPIATLAWGMALSATFANLDVLGRNDGLSGIPALSLFGRSLADPGAMYYLIWTIVLVALVLVGNLLDSKPGRAVRSLIRGTTMPESMGVDTVGRKVSAFMIAALLASTSGWLYAHTIRAVSPSAFSPTYSLEFVFMAVVGGAGAVWGALIGSVFVTVAKDLLQSHLTQWLPVSGNFESIVLGVVMALMLIRTRSGVWPYLRSRFFPADRQFRIDASNRPEQPGRPKPSAGETVLELRGAIKRFGGLVAVNEVSFKVTGSEIVALIGPNGAGKSTTFNLITGVLGLSGGDVVYRGKSVLRTRSRQLAALGMSRTFQHVRLLPEMSVLENVALGAQLWQGTEDVGLLAASLRLDRNVEGRLLRHAALQASRVGLKDALNRPAGSLSLGEQRLVEIARALCNDPALLLLDEPAAGLRYGEKVGLAALLRQLNAEGVSVLLVEHDMEFVMGIADRVVVMDFGTCIAQGLPAEIQRHPEVQRAYLGAA